MDGRDVVGAGRHRGAEPGDVGPELGQVGAEIAQDVDPHGEEAAVLVQRHLGGGEIVAALRVAQEMLGAVGHPLDRRAGRLGGQQKQRIFAIHHRLGAEAAADVVA